MKRISSLNIACLSFGLACHAASAATYYVSSSLGSDSNPGTSTDSPWKTIGKVNHAPLATSDRVYFRSGDRWDDEFLTVAWGGTATRHAVVGAYRVSADGSVSYEMDAGGDRPVIDDHYRWGAREFTMSTGGNPGIDVSGSYVDIENIEISQSGWGLRIAGNAQQAVTIDNVFVNGAYQCGIQANHVTGLTIQNSELYNAEAFHGIFGQSGNWCSTIGVQHSHGVVVQNNTVHESWGEGINVFNGSSDAVVRHNLLYANWAAGIYMGALNGAQVYGNRVLGTADRRFWRDSRSDGPGIAMDNEAYEFATGATSSHGEYTGKGSLCPLGPYGDYSGTGRELCPDALQNIEIHDNLVAGTEAGLAVWYADYPAAYTDLRVYNNTFVDNEQQVYLGGQNTERCYVRNNIFLSLTPGMVDVSGSNYGMTFDTNSWSQGRPRTVGSSPYASATDTLGGTRLARMTGYRGMSAANLFDAAAFSPVIGSRTLGRGTYAGMYFDTDYFGAAIRRPVDLGAIAGTGAH